METPKLTLNDILDVLSDAKADTDLLEKLYELVGPYSHNTQKEEDAALDKVRGQAHHGFRPARPQDSAGLSPALCGLLQGDFGGSLG